MEHPVVLFDGVCNFCSGAVRFIAERDPEGLFRFAPIQSEMGKKLLHDYGVSPPDNENADPDTIILIDHGRALVRSTAVLQIARRLRGPSKIFFHLGMPIPRVFRDFVYDFVAERRYRWFGKTDACMVPTPELHARFL